MKSFDLAEPTPDLQDIAVMMGKSFRGDGLPLYLPPLIEEYQSDIESIVAQLRAGEPLPKGLQLIVPDFWKVAKGRGKSLPKEEGDRLVAAQFYGHRLGEVHFKQDFSDLMPKKHGYPVAVFKVV